MSAPATVPVIDVRLCQNLDCRGFRSCPDVQEPDDRYMAAARFIKPGSMTGRELMDLFAQQLITSAASDSKGARFMVPLGAQFTVHRGAEGCITPEAIRKARETGRENELIEIGNHPEDYCVAVYSGPLADLDDLLAMSPSFSEDLAATRLAEYKASA